ncbi:fimbrial protein [Luteibacter sp. SG786]|uniref:fimbrial protein n=1 Tax=Luteibacter sp. SG786 TaxID=2587130 RepID=UPI0014225857|nr:fimbrial protein [Luteibacter sp. SG786]NII56308.1 type 1 fimbria pilin [Luteibacter sp. SG786]
MNRTIAGCLAAGLLFVGTPAIRADDRLDFHVLGSIAPSCDLVADRIRIDLGAVAAGELAGAGATSPWRGAAFTGRDCIGATRAVVTMRATPYPGHPGLIAPVGEAAGVAIEMRSAGGQPLLPDGSTAVEFSWTAGPPELGFQARYVRVGPLQPGTAGATAQVQIRWE